MLSLRTMTRYLAILICLGLLAACAAPRLTPTVIVTPPVTLAGQLMLDGHAAPGGEIFVYPAAAPSLHGEPAFRTRSAADGRFELALPTAGEYYLLARGEGTFAYYGRNPVTIGGDGPSDLKLGLVSLPPEGPRRRPSEESLIGGTVTHNGVPQAGAVVYAYTDLSSRLKGMGYGMSTPSAADGRFELPLPAGSYYLLARLRRHGGMANGPLRAGDAIGYLADSPVLLGEKEAIEVTIPLLEVPEKVELLAATLFGQTSVSGRILRPDGTPVPGARVLLHDDPRMLNRPLFVSHPSAADGSYQLSFPSGGRYYLSARQSLGGAPAPGELFGTYDGSPDHSLKVESGAREQGVDIVVEEMW